MLYPIFMACTGEAVISVTLYPDRVHVRLRKLPACFSYEQPLYAAKLSGRALVAASFSSDVQVCHQNPMGSHSTMGQVGLSMEVHCPT